MTKTTQLLCYFCVHCLVSHGQDEDSSFRDPRLGATTTEGITPAPFFSDSTTPTVSTAATEFVSHLKKLHPHFATEFDKSSLLQVGQEQDARRSFAPSMDDDQTQERMLPLALRAHRHMIRVREMDKIMMNAQRQGRTSFYMTCKCILEEPVMC